MNTDKELPALLETNLPHVLHEISQFISGNYAHSEGDYQEVRSLFSQSKPHIRVFIKFCEHWDVGPNKARELYASLPINKQQALDSAIKFMIEELK